MCYDLWADNPTACFSWLFQNPRASFPPLQHVETTTKYPRARQIHLVKMDCLNNAQTNSQFGSYPSFEFTEHGANVQEHHLVHGQKGQPWKAHLTPDKKAGSVMEIKGKGTALYAEQGGRGGF
ncbi:hypothetical protein CEP51_001901 [Fusarium floridanum]|uniref:Uncharacterized protein n=1 Tax=Fusarium floridanum TaxID=1325733 RepID=A0A428SE42_9HYPO|nr:hypothetical protein CEP51_001901 [Fusarium floridanum]